MVGAVKILAVPAGREDHSGSDPPRALLERKLRSVLAVTRRKALPVAIATVADTGYCSLLGAQRRVARNHAEPLVKLLLLKRRVELRDRGRGDAQA